LTWFSYTEHSLSVTMAGGLYAALTAASLGIDVMLAPSVDVNSKPANPVISTRGPHRSAQGGARLHRGDHHGRAGDAGDHAMMPIEDAAVASIRPVRTWP
jgi:hypothetical protein